jgi:RNA polymerase sigma-70 factor (ECF subfamily)
MASGDARFSEDDLIRRIRAGDESAFKALFERYEDRLRARIRRWLPGRIRRRVSVVAVMQEAYVVACRRIAEFEQRDEESFGHWLTRIAELKAREAVRDHERDRRSARREATRGARVDTVNLSDGRQSPSQFAIAAEGRRRVDAALREIPDDYREILQLVFREQLSLREAADRMGRSYEAVKKLYGRALCRFRVSWEARSDPSAS